MADEEVVRVPVADYGTRFRPDPDVAWEGVVPPSNFNGKTLDDDPYFKKHREAILDDLGLALSSPTQGTAVTVPTEEAKAEANERFRAQYDRSAEKVADDAEPVKDQTPGLQTALDVSNGDAVVLSDSDPVTGQPGEAQVQHSDVE